MTAVQLLFLNIFWILLSLKLSSGIFYQNDEDPVKSVPEFIQYHGYSSEIHKVNTDDGYILELHRIPNEKNILNVTYSKSRPVVLLVHCALCTSSIWVMQGPEKSLAFLLANNGYDVWMFNARGTTHSKKHVTLNATSESYWEFSWHEMAIYDLPATINYILQNTGEEQLDYIGYSMGTTLFFALTSYKPEYNLKIRKMIALAPAVYLSHSHGMLLYISTFVNHFLKIASAVHQYEFPPNSQQIREKVQQLCNNNFMFFRPSCAKFFHLLTGRTYDTLELENLAAYFMYFPDTSSVRTIAHFYQIRNTGKFRLYNFGKEKNQMVYGSKFPPSYNLSQVTVPVYLVYSEHDAITPALDVDKLKSQLPNVVTNFKINLSGFSHADFGWGTNAKEIVYDFVLRALKVSPEAERAKINKEIGNLNSAIQQ